MDTEKNVFEFCEGNYYTLGHLTQFTGLTDRTLRNYLAMGLLEGEKINGLWHFTAEQVEKFISHPSVKPSITAKRNSLVYDFLIGSEETVDRCCIVLDLPKKQDKKAIEYFCYEINNGEFHNLKFSLDAAPKNKATRIILKGETAQILQLVNGYYEKLK